MQLGVGMRLYAIVDNEEQGRTLRRKTEAVGSALGFD
jgi:hypothetical protein